MTQIGALQHAAYAGGRHSRTHRGRKSLVSGKHEDLKDGVSDGVRDWAGPGRSRFVAPSLSLD